MLTLGYRAFDKEFTTAALRFIQIHRVYPYPTNDSEASVLTPTDRCLHKDIPNCFHWVRRVGTKFLGLSFFWFWLVMGGGYCFVLGFVGVSLLVVLVVGWPACFNRMRILFCLNF